MALYYRKKLILCKNYVEEITYKKPISYGRHRIILDDYCVDILKEDSKRSVHNNIRVNAQIRRMVNMNFSESDKFLTLTYAGIWVDVKKSNYEFKKFVQRLRFYLKKNFNFIGLKYFAVVEFQNDYYFKHSELKKAQGGNVHYHLICNLPDIDVGVITKEIWGNGYCWISKVRKVKNIGAYFAKHNLKYNQDELVKLAGEKKYFCSRNLEKPIIYIDENLIDWFFAHNRLEQTYENTKTFDIQNTNEKQTITYRTYLLK